VTAVWFDFDEENFVVQQRVCPPEFHKREFTVFFDCLNESCKKYACRTTVDYEVIQMFGGAGLPRLKKAEVRAQNRSIDRVFGLPA
jgi:hypothetical protein